MIRSFTFFFVAVSLVLPLRAEGEKPVDNPSSSEPTTQPEPAHSDGPFPRLFLGTSLIHMPTTEQVGAGDLDFHFDHRFGDAKNTLGDFFGLDQGAGTSVRDSFCVFADGGGRSGNRAAGCGCISAARYLQYRQRDH